MDLYESTENSFNWLHASLYMGNFYILTGFEKILSFLPSSILDHFFLYLVYSFYVLFIGAPQVNISYSAPMLWSLVWISVMLLQLAQTIISILCHTILIYVVRKTKLQKQSLGFLCFQSFTA